MANTDRLGLFDPVEVLRLGFSEELFTGFLTNPDGSLTLTRPLHAPNFMVGGVPVGGGGAGVSSDWTYNVKAETWGALGTGVNDTTAIQNAINAAASAYAATGQPQTVYFPPGVYGITTLAFRIGVFLVGAGWTTVFRALADQRMFETVPVGTPVNNLPVLARCGIFNCMVDGNFRNNGGWSSVEGITVEGAYGSQFHIDNVLAYDCRRQGFRASRTRVITGLLKAQACGMAGYGSVLLDDCGGSRIGMLDARSSGGREGLGITNSSDPVVVENVIVTDTLTDGILLQSARFVQIMSGRTLTTPSYGVRLNTAHDCYLGPLNLRYGAAGIYGIDSDRLTAVGPTLQNQTIGVQMVNGAQHRIVAPRFIDVVTQTSGVMEILEEDYRPRLALHEAKVATPLVLGHIKPDGTTLQVAGDGTATAKVGYRHVQSTPDTVWTITHNLGRRPTVRVVDATGATVWGEVQDVTNNQLTVTFSTAISGEAYLG